MYDAKGRAPKDRVIEQHIPLVKKLAYQLKARLPANVEVDDLIQAGTIGLLDAMSRYEVTQGALFETYAVQRIRGAMLDELRSQDWLPRSVRQNMRQIEGALSELQQELLRTLKPDSNYWLIDVELEQDDPFVLPEIAQSELLVLTSTAPSSIKRAYSQLKAMQTRLDRRPCYLLVVSATTQQAELVQQNMAQAASRYLEIALTSLGSIPADEQLLQAESMGRALVSSQPKAEASVAFRRMATQLMSSMQGMHDFSSAGMATARRA